MSPILQDRASNQSSDNPQSPFPPGEQDPLDPAFTDDLLHALAAALPSPDKETDERKASRRAAAVIALRSFDVQQPIDAMLATHAVLAHQFAMECYRRAATSSRTSELETRLLGTAAMLTHTLRATLHTLQGRQDDEPLWCGSSETPFP